MSRKEKLILITTVLIISMVTASIVVYIDRKINDPVLLNLKGMTVLIAFVGVFSTTVYKINDNLISKFKQKADKNITEEQYKHLHEKINAKANNAEFQQVKKMMSIMDSRVYDLWRGNGNGNKNGNKS